MILNTSSLDLARPGRKCIVLISWRHIIILFSSFLLKFASAQNLEEAKLLHSPQSVNVSLNEVAEFNCTANSDNIVWRTNGVDVNSGQILFIEIAQSIYLSTMKSTALASLDNTNITCTAVKLTPPSSNESEPALLLVQGLLESVSNLIVTPVNSTTVLISWNPPFTLEGVPILGYNVTITTSGENETMSVEGDTTMLYYSIDHLKSTFTITVVPINVVGVGDKASILYNTTTTSSTSQAVVPSVNTVTSAIHVSRTPIPLLSTGDNLAATPSTCNTTSQAVVPSVTVTSASTNAVLGGTLAAASVLVGMLALVFVFVTIFMFCHGRRDSKTLKKEQVPTPLKQLSDLEIAAFPLAHITQPAAYPQHSIANQAQVAVTHESLETVQFETDNLILSRDDIKLGKKIGNGTFGDVHEARLVSSNQQVAVKACKTSHSDAVKCQFLYEADIVRHYKHPNIVKLIGVVVPHHEQEPLSIVMEFVGWTFQYFLQANGSKCETAVLTEMCAQVCTGMEYLERSNCVHRSLTARNCLVGENNIVKISNFGTCHGKIHLDPSDSKLRPAPVKWTAPEALKSGKYSSASDVWSFGVLLWQTFSLGEEPYPDVTNDEVRKKVKKGYRMPPPTNCPPPVYDVMEKCWEYEPSNRPTFAKLLNEMRKLIDLNTYGLNKLK